MMTKIKRKKVKWLLPEEVKLTLNYFELGSLIGALGIGKQKQLPESLQLKLKYWFSNAYKDHPALGKQAKKEMKGYKKALKELK